MICRKLREALRSLTDEMHILRYLESFRETLWPGGEYRTYSSPRDAAMKAETREEANKKLSALIPGEIESILSNSVRRPNSLPVDLAGNMIGTSNAKRGARRIFTVLQNRRLNQHIVFTVLDEVRTVVLLD
jgi:sorting nexin-25